MTMLAPEARVAEPADVPRPVAPVVSVPEALPYALPSGRSPTGFPMPHRFTIEEWRGLSGTVEFEGRKIEMIEGEAFDMAAMMDPHIFALGLSVPLMLRLYPDRTQFTVDSQVPLWLERSAPEPDLTVTACPHFTPTAERPLPLFVIEISDTSYTHDTGRKLRAYASEGVRDYWVLNLNERRLEVYRRPTQLNGPDGPWGYADVTHLGEGEAVTPLEGPRVTIQVAEMLPPVQV